MYGVPGPNRLYGQADSDFVFLGDVTGSGIPAAASRYETVTFSTALTNAQIDDLIREGRLEAERERARLSLPPPTRMPSASYDWTGGVPGHWLPRLRFRTNMVHPAAWAGPKAWAATPPPVLPLAGAGGAPGAPLAPLIVPHAGTPLQTAPDLSAGDGSSWVVSEVGCDSHPFGTCLDKLPVGSRIAGQRGLLRVGENEYITAELMATAMVHAWSDAFRTKVSKLVSTPRGKGGKEEKPTEEFFIGDKEAPPKGAVADDGDDHYQEARTLAV